MVKELMDLYQEYVDLEDEERVGRTAHAAVDALEGLNKIVEDKDACLGFLLNLIRLAVNADGVASEEERKLFNDLFDTNYSSAEFANLFNKGSQAELDEYDQILDKMDQDTKFALCYVVLGFLSADGKLTTGEVEKFEQLLFVD